MTEEIDDRYPSEMEIEPQGACVECGWMFRLDELVLVNEELGVCQDCYDEDLKWREK